MPAGRMPSCTAWQGGRHAAGLRCGAWLLCGASSLLQAAGHCLIVFQWRHLCINTARLATCTPTQCAWQARSAALGSPVAGQERPGNVRLCSVHAATSRRLQQTGGTRGATLTPAHPRTWPSIHCQLAQPLNPETGPTPSTINWPSTHLRRSEGSLLPLGCTLWLLAWPAQPPADHRCRFRIALSAWPAQPPAVGCVQRRASRWV